MRTNTTWLVALTLLVRYVVTQGLEKTILSGDDCLNVQKAIEGDEVTVHYEGRLASNDFKFDSSLDRGKPITFELGSNLVIKGWDQGLKGTCPGQKIKLEIPSELGYGAEGAGEVIPPNSDLIFEVTLESLKSKKVKIEVLDAKNCTKDTRTRNNDILVFDYIGYFEDGKKFDSTKDEGREPLEATVGKIGFKGWDDALIGACPGESRLVFIPYELAYGEKGVENFVPPKSNLVLQIEILKVRSRVLNFLDRISSGGFNG